MLWRAWTVTRRSWRSTVPQLLLSVVFVLGALHSARTTSPHRNTLLSAAILVPLSLGLLNRTMLRTRGEVNLRTGALILRHRPSLHRLVLPAMLLETGINVLIGAAAMAALVAVLGGAATSTVVVLLATLAAVTAFGLLAGAAAFSENLYILTFVLVVAPAELAGTTVGGVDAGYLHPMAALSTAVQALAAGEETAVGLLAAATVHATIALALAGPLLARSIRRNAR